MAVTNDSFIDNFIGGFDLDKEEPEITPELRLFTYYAKGEKKGELCRMYNAHYFLKHALRLHYHLTEKGWLISKPILGSVNRRRVELKELSRAYLEYWFEMNNHEAFHSERGRAMGKNADMQKFLDLVMEFPQIKNLIEDPLKNFIWG